MADNNKNPRRTVWLSETEPLSHYDIWLSKNQHLNSDGEPVSDSGVQRPCDYIFKVWDCDNWYPIIGFNSNALNKINTVKNQEYTSLYNGEEINSFSYQEFHLPLFTKPISSPSELFDAGTLGYAIKKYVTKEEWENIFEGKAFVDAFELNPAESNKLGGIWADVFQPQDIFPNTQESIYYSEQNIITSYNWLAQAKYRLNHDTSDYNLYVSAKDIINIINQYGEDNPNTSGININIDNLIQELKNILKNSASLQFEGMVWGSANDPHVYPSIWGVGPSTAGRFLRINPEWNYEESGWSQSNNNMDWVDLREIIPDLVKDEHIFVPKDGISISYVAPHDDNRQYVEWGLNHIEQATDGQCCIKKTSQGVTDIDWVDLPEGIEYTPGTGITISPQNEISIDINEASTNQVLTKTADGVGWTTPQQTTYTAGVGIDVTGTTISGYIRLDEEIVIPATSSVVIDTMSITQSFPKGGCRINIDGDPQGGVQPYHYKIINFSPEANSTLEFDVLNSITYLKGDPVYFRINIDTQTNPDDITVSFGNDGEYIIHDEALVENNAIYTFNPKFYKYLVTIQFGIVKFEVIEISQTTNNIDNN